MNQLTTNEPSKVQTQTELWSFRGSNSNRFLSHINQSKLPLSGIFQYSILYLCIHPIQTILTSNIIIAFQFIEWSPYKSRSNYYMCLLLPLFIS